jgi:hypothetical protein
MSAPQGWVNADPHRSGLSRIVTIESLPGGPQDFAAASPERGRQLCEELEHGNLLFCPRTPFAFSPEELEFLLSRKQTGASYHKNVAYRPAEDRLTGLEKSPAAEAARFRSILRGYSDSAARFIAALLPPYAHHLRRDLTSYRPLEERGRAARLHARNDLLHVDAFPTRPTNGDRILRVFTNLNPAEERVWLTSETFATLGPRVARTIGLPGPPSSRAPARALRAMLRALRWPGAARSPYDDFMHRCHNALKEDSEFQAHCLKQRLEFPPGSTWIVYTDMVSHAALSGQFAVEQTFLVSRGAMVLPEMSPISILEALCGYPLANPA